jgi:hypothetical protein
MTYHRHLALRIGLLVVCFSGAVRADEPAATPKNVEPSPGAAERQRTAIFYLTPEQADAWNKAADGLKGEATKEDFERLEKQFAFFRQAPGAMWDGTSWLLWFYEILHEPEKHDVDSWNAHFAKLDRWMKAFPESATPLELAARAHLARGWEERGTGYANTVSEARWAIFHDQIEQAYDLLEKAREMKGHDVDVYRQLVLVGKAQGADRRTIDEYLAEARKIDPHYYNIYEEIAVDLLPRWGGDPGDIGEFAEKMLKENPGDEGLEIYARIAAVVNNYDKLLLLEGELDIEKVRAGARVLQARYPESPVLQSFAGLVGWRTQDLEMAKAAKATVDKKLVDRVWGNPEFHKGYQQFCSLTIAPPKRQRILWTVPGAPFVTAISPSGNSLLIGSQSPPGVAPVTVRTMKDLSVVAELTGAGPMPDDIAIDSAGTKVAVSFQAFPPSRIPSMLALYTVGDWQNRQLLEDKRAETFGALCFAPDGKLLAAAHEGVGIGLWNVETGKLERVIESIPNLRKIFFSPDGALVVGYHESSAQISEVATGKALHELPFDPAPDGAHMKTVLGFQQDGRLLAAGNFSNRGGNAIFSWDHVNNRRRDLIVGAPGLVCAVSPKQSFLVLIDSLRDASGRFPLTSVSIWSVSQRRKLAEYGVAAPAMRFAFSQDEKTLSFVVSDRSVRLWDLSEFLPQSE